MYNYIQSNRNRVLGLDILRSIAILLVVFGHSTDVLPKSYQNYYSSWAPELNGVSIFFVLSGFLIGGILLRTFQESSFTLKDILNFWIRRWFRTLPNYFFVLFCLILYLIIIRHHQTEFNLKYLLFMQNLTSPHPYFFPEAWSLSVEEWFYFLFPISSFVLFKLLRDKSKSILFSALFFLFIPFLMRLFCYIHGIGIENIGENYRKVVILRLDSLMYGIIGAYIYKFKNDLWNKYKMPCLGASLVLVFCLSLYAKFISDIAFESVYYFNFESLATLLMLPYFSELKYSRSVAITFIFTFISINSYSMYLLNYSPILHHLLPRTFKVLSFLSNDYEYLFVFKYLTFWFYVLVGSFILYRYFEKPMMDLRDKIRL